MQDSFSGRVGPHGTCFTSSISVSLVSTSLPQLPNSTSKYIKNHLCVMETQ